VFDHVPEYFLRVAPEKTQDITETFTKLRAAKQAARGGAKENLKALLPEVDKLIRYFILQEANFINKTSRAEYEQNLRSLRLSLQDADVLLSKEYNEARDRYMAENILYLLNRESADTRIAVWAHNYHISTGEIPSPGGSVGKWMGAHLRQKLSGGYYALGFAFNEGSFQATSTTASGETQFVEYTVGPAGEGSLNWYFAQPKIENYMIDFRHTPKNEAVQQWLTTPRGLGSQGGYNIPADYKERWADGGKTFQWATLSKEYDGMIFIERTTRARPLSR
jgi:erythromycin esterase